MVFNVAGWRVIQAALRTFCSRMKRDPSMGSSPADRIPLRATDQIAGAASCVATWGCGSIILARAVDLRHLLFVSYAFARNRDAWRCFNAAQATLDLHSGAFNTVLLITGSWCVARAVQAVRSAMRRRLGLRWLLAAMVLRRQALCVVKLAEYAGQG
jgi:hypothetical protein